MDKIEEARVFAAERHGAKRYGDRPYSYHTDMVCEILRSYGYGGGDLEVAGHLHDVEEDTDTSREELALRFGADVEAMVWAVTGVGKNRREKNAAMFEKIRALPQAAVLKLADRHANGRCAKGDSPGLFQMYQKEMPLFRKELAGLGDPRMWADLEALFA